MTAKHSDEMTRAVFGLESLPVVKDVAAANVMLVLIACAQFVNPGRDGGAFRWCAPPEKIAETMPHRPSPRLVYRVLAELERLGWISQQRGVMPGRGDRTLTPTWWTAHLDRWPLRIASSPATKLSIGLTTPTKLSDSFVGSDTKTSIALSAPTDSFVGSDQNRTRLTGKREPVTRSSEFSREKTQHAASGARPEGTNGFANVTQRCPLCRVSVGHARVDPTPDHDPACMAYGLGWGSPSMAILADEIAPREAALAL